MEGRRYDVEEIIKNFGLESNTVLNIYLYGSRVYGTESKTSDWDFIIIVEDDNEKFSVNEQCFPGNDGNSDAVIMTASNFQSKINDHQIHVLECLWLSPDKILLEKRKFSFVLDLTLLRIATQKRSGNSWSKTGKKLIQGPDYAPYIAKKSLFHCLRILQFAVQIAKNGKIIDYSSANPIWFEIIATDTEDWEIFKQMYQKLYNSLKSELRILAPKQ